MYHSHDCRSRLLDGSGSLTDFARGTVCCDLDLINGTTVTTAGHQRGRIAAYHSRDVHRRRITAPSKRFPEVIGDKLFAIFEPYVRECLAGKAVEFEIEMPYQAGEPQFLQLRLPPE